MSRSSADDEVIARAKEGDWAAWRTLYGAHAGRLVLWLRTIGPVGEAEDLAAEAWLTAAGKIKEFSGSSSEFAGWIFAIARNLVLNARRRTARRATSAQIIEDEDMPLWGAVSDPAEDATGSDLTRRLLSKLPRREAEVVACIDVVGLDVPATAKALGISATAVRVAHHRGLNRLRKLV